MMDHQGERRNPLVELDRDVIQEMVRDAGYDIPIRQVQAFSTGYSNTNYKIELEDSQSFVLRIFANHTDSAKLEILILDFVKGKLAVPKVLLFDDSMKAIPYCFALLEWKKGQLLSQVFNQLSMEEILEIGRELGASLAQLSQFNFPSMGLLNSKLEIRDPFYDMWGFFFPFVEDCLVRGRAGERLGSEVTRRILHLISDHESLLRAENLGPSLVHGDFNGKNILIEKRDGHWQIDAILDWEFACSGPFLTDFGNLLRYDAKFPSALEKGLVTGFRNYGGILVENWKKIAKLLDLVNLCDFLNTKTHKPIIWEDSKRLIFDTLERWDTF